MFRGLHQYGPIGWHWMLHRIFGLQYEALLFLAAVPCCGPKTGFSSEGRIRVLWEGQKDSREDSRARENRPEWKMHGNCNIMPWSNSEHEGLQLPTVKLPQSAPHSIH